MDEEYVGEWIEWMAVKMKFEAKDYDWVYGQRRAFRKTMPEVTFMVMDGGCHQSLLTRRKNELMCQTWIPASPPLHPPQPDRGSSPRLHRSIACRWSMPRWNICFVPTLVVWWEVTQKFRWDDEKWKLENRSSRMSRRFNNWVEESRTMSKRN